MTREQLGHVIRASAAIAGVEDIVVIGSQSVLGQFPDAPAELLVSREAADRPDESVVGHETRGGCDGLGERQQKENT